ncbi:MAG: PEP/pyruvate-binding domain-containing protein [Actinomycetota bacterium]
MSGVVELGEGRLAELGVGAKAANLDRARRAGLPVPDGRVLLDDAEPSPADAHGLGSVLAVRSAFSAEDSPTASMAGRFRTELGVDPADVVPAIRAVRASAAASEAADLRLDVAIMRQIDAHHAGVAFSEPGWEDDVVNVVAGLGDDLVGGRTGGERVRLPRLRRFERARRSLPAWQRRLAVLLRDVRREFGDAPWDVEWADDGDVCWLLQVRPVTVALVRDEAFTIANHKEILPELPSTFMASLITSCADDLFGFYRRIDPSQPDHRPFVESFAGRPYLNLSLLEDLLRSLGLPTRLLADSLGGEVETDVALNPVRLALRAPTLVRFGLAQAGAIRSSGRRVEQLRRLAADRRGTFAGALDDLRTVYVGLVQEMSSLASAMAPQVSLLRRAGVLHEHVSRQRTPATAMLDDLRPLAELVDRPGVRADLDAGAPPSDPDAAAAWQGWLARHGHRGVFESDIARPRHAEAPGPILRSVSSLRPPAAPGPRSPLAMLTLPLWWSAARAMRAREELRSEAMRTFLAVRADLLRLATAADVDGDTLWSLDVDEVRRLDEGWRPDAAHLEGRRRQIDDHRDHALPDLLHRFDDLTRHRRSSAPAAERSTVTGIGLTPGVVTGRALVAAEPPAHPPTGDEVTVLVARSVDAGWIAAFGSVDGVVVDMGGDLSHGSIILRELGLPAVTNAAGASAAIRSGDLVELDATRGVVRVLQRHAA